MNLTRKEKNLIAAKLRYQVQYGLIPKPDKCEKCGKPHQRIEGHHRDYSRPFEVIWLCPYCHRSEHAGGRELNCLRCGHKWKPRNEDVRQCPKCKSAYWDKPKGG